MANSSPQPERERVEHVTQRVQDLWFADANLILRAEDTLFRIHSGLLAARSPVFRDMVAFPQPANAEGDVIDGYPVVRLHDSAAEVEVFLRAVFDSSFFMPPPSPVDFATVIGVLRLAHKYDVQYLFRRALSHLDSMYPTQFLDFLEVNSGNKEHHVSFPFGIHTDLIVLRTACELGATWLLPTAYYSVCAYSTREILGSGASWSALGLHQQQTCLVAQPELMRATAWTHAFLQDVSDHPDCSTPDDCAEAVSEAREMLLQWSRQGYRDGDPLQTWVFAEIEAESEGQTVLCPGCTKIGEERYDAAQKEFWHQMPHMFGLPGWEELREMRWNTMRDAA
ncbi:hypothetical protein B0H11DRAFT_1921359 [Mycena galericulata]|nr:hypothetical protein B0H11DRAFT_1921359 [Mycena galericulata]